MHHVVLLALFMLAGLTGCGPEVPPLVVDRMTPDWGYNGEVSEVVIEGANFYPQVEPSAFGGADVFREFRGWLQTEPDPTEIDLLFIGYSQLKAQVPSGIAVGRYDLVVESPAGHRDTLADAFQVTDTRADHLVATSESNAFVVGYPVILSVEVQDPEGYVVPVDLDLLVTVDGGDNDANGIAWQDTLDGQKPYGKGIQGTLRNGQGIITLTSMLPDDLWITIAPADKDSVVDPFTAFITFRAGQVQGVEIDILDAGTSFDAGETVSARLSLVDSEGNAVTGVAASVLLYEQCPTGQMQQTVNLTGEIIVDLALTGATGGVCAENRVLASTIVEGAFVTGESEALEIAHGPPDGLGVVTTPLEVRAGEDEVTVYLEMQDAWGNWVFDHQDGAPEIVLKDNVGGLSLTQGVQTCGGFVAGKGTCEAVLWKSASDVRITATDIDGRNGEGNPIDVLPGFAFAIDVDLATPTVDVIAGEEFELRLRVLDAVGNPLELDPALGDEPIFEDDDGTEVDCSYEGEVAGIDDVHSFLCTTYAADPNEKIIVDMPSRGLVGFSTSTFNVINNELAIVEIDLGGVTAVTAGQTFNVDFFATDAWGNPYVEQSDPVVDLFDATGSIDPHQVILDSSGMALGEGLSVPVSTPANQVVARQDGTWLGVSSVFTVEAAALDGLEVELEAPVVQVGEAVDVTVRAVDAYGNAVPGYSGTVTLSSDDALGEDVEISTWVDGEAVVPFVFDVLGMQDQLSVDDGVRSGISTALDVVDFTCATPPTAILDAPSRLCMVGGGSTLSTTLDLTASLPGAALLDIYHHFDGEGWVRGTDPEHDHSWSVAGAYPVQGIVIDEDGCASQDTSVVYAGPDDGQPVGPVDVAPLSPTVDAEIDVATVEISAVDCSGDPSAWGTLLARADIGDLTGSSVVDSGIGREVSLDGLGEASVSWSMLKQPTGGIGTFYAGVATGAAYGAVTIEITGDASHPVVWHVEPSGQSLDNFSEIEMVFSDPMQASSFASGMDLLNPSGIPVAYDSLWLSDDGRTVVADYSLLSGSAGAWELSLSSAIRKEPGALVGANPLDGAFVGAGSDFVLTFGDVLYDAPDITGCTPDTVVFRPDGDDSGGAVWEADAVSMDVAADGAAEWWMLEVYDAGWEPVAVLHTDAGGASDATLSWDGRDNGGFVVDNGNYWLIWTAKDVSWNQGTSCAVRVAVDNLVVGGDE